MRLTDDNGDLPDELLQPVSVWLQHLGDDYESLAGSDRQRLLRTVACSEFAAQQIRRDWDWFRDSVADFSATADEAHFRRLAEAMAVADLEVATAKALLRQFRNRYLLRVYWRDLHGLADVSETLQQLSLLADQCLLAATDFALAQLQARHGLIRDRSGEQIPLVILGMGKLGGRELNFSSDIDLIFCFSQDGMSDGEKTLSAQEYFDRWSRLVIALLDEITVDGFVFRVDTRLRPFGDSGPPSVSFAALENYLLQHGRDWERYAYVKARVVGRQPAEAVLDELCDKLIKPFVYRRYLDFGVFESLREMHALIAAEVKRRDLSDNIKLGPGGIREIEFIVQAMQLVRGGSDDQFQGRELQCVLPRLVNRRGLSETAAADMLDAYRFLRRLENFIQAIRDQQTHELPENSVDRARLCLAMGFDDWDSLTGALQGHRQLISAQFDRLAFQERGQTEGNDEFSLLWQSGADVERWRQAFAKYDADNADALAAELVSFIGQGVLRVADVSSQERLQRLMPKLLPALVAAPRPPSAMRRCLAVIEGIVRRSAYIALLNENETALKRLVELCGRSQYIADQLARYPVLLDELLDPRGHTAAVTKQDLIAELTDRVGEEHDSEQCMQLTARFQRAVMFRIAVADFADALPIMKVSDGLTWLAEAVVQQALSAAWRDLVERHGSPGAGFGVIAYGKLGGLELSYGSDLDIVFLHNSASGSSTDGDKPLDNTLFFSRLVRRLVHFLTTQTGSGQLYEVDTRLRPDGKSGLLVTGIDGFERYQEENAWTWEHQALLRARAIAGDADVGKEFERVRRETLTRRVRLGSLRDDVIEMRARMRKELDRSDEMRLDLKHGSGGIGDIEFLVQYLVLSQAATYPSLIEFTDNIRQLDALVAADVVDNETGRKLQDVYRSYRAHLHHRTLDERGPVAGAERFADSREFVVACWERWLG